MTAQNASAGPRLRDVIEADLPIFFAHQRDPVAFRMAAFVPRERDAFMAHWTKILADPATHKKTIIIDGSVAGNVVCFEREAEHNVASLRVLEKCGFQRRGEEAGVVDADGDAVIDIIMTLDAAAPPLPGWP